MLRFKLGYTKKIVPVKKKNTNQHHLWQATTCKQHTIIYELTKKEDNFLKFATTNKNSTFDLATSAQQIVRQKKMDLHKNTVNTSYFTSTTYKETTKIRKSILRHHSE